MFQHKAYVCHQVIDAYTCPVNRHSTRVEHNCDDFELYKHPEWLVEHYIKHGGAKKWAERRSEYEKQEVKEINDVLPMRKKS